MCSARAVSCALLALLCEVSCVPHTAPSPVALLTSSSSFLTAEEGEPRGGGGTNHSLAVGSRIRSIAKDLPALKNVVICVCALTALLIICLLVKVYRSGRKIRKTRKYDVITTSAERVEMAPLNDENDDEDDATVFDVKYR